MNHTQCLFFSVCVTRALQTVSQNIVWVWLLCLKKNRCQSHFSSPTVWRFVRTCPNYLTIVTQNTWDSCEEDTQGDFVELRQHSWIKIAAIWKPSSHNVEHSLSGKHWRRNEPVGRECFRFNQERAPTVFSFLYQQQSVDFSLVFLPNWSSPPRRQVYHDIIQRCPLIGGNW